MLDFGEATMHSTVDDPGPGSGYYPSGSLLDRWSESAWENGLQIDRLRDLQSLKVRTRNSLYEFTIISATQGMVLVRGGLHFPEWTPVGLSGSTLGGSFIKARGIYVGFCMEFHLGEMRIFTTSRVQWIGPVEDPGEIADPAYGA
jgi:hypothetical protein